MGDPLAFPRRTPLRRALEAFGPVTWSSLDDAAVADEVGSDTRSSGVMIADLSPLPRLGFKGRGTLPAMAARGVRAETAPNRAFRQPDGGLCLVLGASEVLLLGPLDGAGAGLAALERDWTITAEERTYPVPRRDSHAWFGLTGPDVPTFMAKLCAVDLRPNKFADGAIAQTSVARLNAIVLRADRDGGRDLHLLADSASAAYLLACLVDAAEEFGGRVVGRRAFMARDG